MIYTTQWQFHAAYHELCESNFLPFLKVQYRYVNKYVGVIVKCNLITADLCNKTWLRLELI